MANNLVEKFGSLEMSKGEIRKGHTLFAWDAVQECQDSECPIHDECKYVKKGPCTVQVRYLETIILTVMDSYKYLDDAQLAKIGMHIIPLYSNLVRLKIIERSVKTSQIMQYTARGMFVHPVFGEIRKTLQTISMMWKDLQIKPFNPAMPDPSDPSSEPVENDPRMIHGDPDYYDKLVDSSSKLRRKGVR